MKNRRWLKTAAVILLTLLVICPLMARAAGAAEAVKTVKIGIVSWLGWPLGLSFANEARILADLINTRGGLAIGEDKYKIDLFVEDSKLSNDIARGAVEKLVYQNNVKFIVGDETVDAWLPITEQNNVLSIAGTPSGAIFNPKYKKAFQGAAIQCQMQQIFGWVAKNYPNKKTQVFVAPDNKIGHLEYEKAQRVANAYGFKILDSIFYPMQQTDLSAIGTKVKTINPDICIFDAGGPVKDPTLMKVTREAGYTGQFLFPNSSVASILLKSASAEVLEGWIGGIYDIEKDPPPPVAREFKDAYLAKYGKWDDPDTLFINGWYLLLAGLQQAKSVDPEKVADTIGKGMRFESVNGACMTVARPDQENPRAVDTMVAFGIKTIQGGKAKLLHQLTLEEAFQLNKTFYGWK
jgi:ABC-type branched-subunit amino acid transport system substrate-binding protein